MVDKKVAEFAKSSLLGEPEVVEKVVSVIYDKKQFSIRIPKEFAEAIGLDEETDKFRFKLTKPPFDKGEPTLSGELIQDAERKEGETSA
jgi:hypothetical protein